VGAGPRPNPRRADRHGVYVAVAIFYALLFLAVIWPVYPLFARIEPRILGMPLSMAYVVAALLLSFAILLGLYLWEGAGRGVEPDLGVEPDVVGTSDLVGGPDPRGDAG